MSEESGKQLKRDGVVPDVVGSIGNAINSMFNSAGKDADSGGGETATMTDKTSGTGEVLTTYQEANDAVDIDRYLKDGVYGFLPPMNWWDMLPDWPAISYTALIMDQTRAAKKFILEDIPNPDETELEIESHKYPYRNVSPSILMKGLVTPGIATTVVGQELLQVLTDKDTVKETDPVIANFPAAFVNTTTQINSKYFPIFPIFQFLNTYRDDLTDQKNPALDLVDMQKLVDEFLDIGKRMYDKQTENPTIFGFDYIVSRYEKDKNIVLANYKQYKANVRKMEHLNNIVESHSNNYLIENVPTRYYLPAASNTQEYATRYLREKLLAWYNLTDDPETKVWSQYHWLPGEPGYIEMLLTVGDYEWYNNLIAGLEDSAARLEDLEATLDLIASMANALGTLEKYEDSVELAEYEVEDPEWRSTVTFTEEIIDWTMLKELVGLSSVIGRANGELTPIRGELESLRVANQAILQVVRFMAPTVMAFPIIWSRLIEYVAKVNVDIFGFLNTLILDLRGDFETAGKHSSPSHLFLDISEQLSIIIETVISDVINVIDLQASLPMMGLHRLDSMLNKINEIRKWGPMCDIPWHYWMAIDNVNAAERLYNDIWSDVFDCWEREYITRVWKVVTEHHLSGVIPAVHYGKPLFSAECPHHIPMLLAPVPVDYRDIDIKWLSANCRKNFNFLCSWLTSTLYALGVKRTALAAVINDTSLNGNDENLVWLQELNTLNMKNNIIKKETDKIIAGYNGAGPLLEKVDLDRIIAAKELSPQHYSNQALMNMSSQLHLLNTWPITTFDVASNENRTGTIVSNSPPLIWESKPALKPEVDVNEIAEKIAAQYGEDYLQTPEGVELLKSMAPEVIVDVLQVNTIPTTGGPAEVVIDAKVAADQSAYAKGVYVGDVEEFEPWNRMGPDWDTRRETKELPVVIPPETSPVIPDEQEIEMPSIRPVAEIWSSIPAEIFSGTSGSAAPRDSDKTRLNNGENPALSKAAMMKANTMNQLLRSITKGLANKK